MHILANLFVVFMSFALGNWHSFERTSNSVFSTDMDLMKTNIENNMNFIINDGLKRISVH